MQDFATATTKSTETRLVFTYTRPTIFVTSTVASMTQTSTFTHMASNFLHLTPPKKEKELKNRRL